MNQPAADRADGRAQTGTSPETLTAAEAIVAQFLDRWRRQGQRPSVEQFASTINGPHRPAVLLALVKADMRERGRLGEPVRAEEYLSRFPELGATGKAPLALIAEEYAIRSAGGVQPGLDEYAGRFPDQIAFLLDELGGPAGQLGLRGCHPERSEGSQSAEIRCARNDRIDDLAAPRGRGPLALEAGCKVGDFEIIQALGQGAQSRVYLARQLSLDRLVALKVTERLGPGAGDEGRTQAALEHDHILPVYAEQIVGNYRLLATRWVPGITLARLLEQLDGCDRRRITGRYVAQLVDAEISQHTATTDNRDRQRFDRSSFVRTACHLVAGLARALEHAHRHGILHRDIKPANILVAQNGRAMLMDFNLAGRTVVESGVFGGTPAYMAPEHLAAMAARAPQTPVAVDQRSDVFSLGVVFYELLTGRHPFCQTEGAEGDASAFRRMMGERLQGAPSVQSAGLIVSPGLESIVAKCLAPRASDRYESAGQLAEDLERFLDHRALQFAADPSWLERSGKWLRRHPRVAGAVAATVVVCWAAVAGTWAIESWRLHQAESLIHRVSERLDGTENDAEAFLEDADRLLGDGGTGSHVLGLEGCRSRLRAEWWQLTNKIAGPRTERFATLADAERAGVDAQSAAGALRRARTYSTDPLAVFQVLDRADWPQRALFRALKPADRSQIEEDVTELLLDRVLDALQSPSVQVSAADALVTALDLLNRVPPRLRRCWAVQQVLRAASGDREIVTAAPTASADLTEFELYLMGIYELKRGNDEAAIRNFTAAIQQRRTAGQPPRFWAYFQRAYCFDRLGRTEQAIADYGTCIGLRSDFAWPHNNLGLIYAERGEYDQAIAHFHDAILCDPELGPALMNLGSAQYRLDRFVEANASFTQAIDNGHLTANLLATALANRSSARVALGEHDAALGDARRAVEIDPECELARRNLDLLTARSGSGPELPPDLAGERGASAP